MHDNLKKIKTIKLSKLKSPVDTKTIILCAHYFKFINFQMVNVDIIKCLTDTNNTFSYCYCLKVVHNGAPYNKRRAMTGMIHSREFNSFAN